MSLAKAPGESLVGTFIRRPGIVSFEGGLRKVELASHVSASVKPERNTSSCFQAFVEVVRAAPV